jgi:hypothetical protein
MIGIKSAALAGALVLGGGATADTGAGPPPVIGTVSCVDGQTSWAAATCKVQEPDQQHPTRVVVWLSCPVGEFAISAGFRRQSGDYRPLVEMSPIVARDSHASGYRFTWWHGRNVRPAWKATDLKTYITCERLSRSGPTPPPPPEPVTAGPSGLDVIRVGKDVTDGNTAAEVLCPPDHPYVIGGGGQAETGNGSPDPLFSSLPQPSDPGWEVQASIAPTSLLSVYAICAK